MLFFGSVRSTLLSTRACILVKLLTTGAVRMAFGNLEVPRFVLPSNGRPKGSSNGGFKITFITQMLHVGKYIHHIQCLTDSGAAPLSIAAQKEHADIVQFLQPRVNNMLPNRKRNHVEAFNDESHSGD